MPGRRLLCLIWAAADGGRGGSLSTCGRQAWEASGLQSVKSHGQMHVALCTCWQIKGPCGCRRIGEAENPGPYHVGGATSSGGGQGEAATGTAEVVVEQVEVIGVAKGATTSVGPVANQEDDWLWEQEQWVQECEEGLLGRDGVGVGLDRGHMDKLDWSEGLDEELAHLMHGDMGLEEDGGEQQQSRGNGNEWWSLHDSDLMKIARGGKGDIQALTRGIASPNVQDWAEEDLPTVQDIRSRAGGGKVLGTCKRQFCHRGQLLT